MKPTSFDVTRTRNSWTAHVTSHGTLPVFHKQYWNAATGVYEHTSRVSPALFQKQIDALRAAGKAILQIDAEGSHASAGYLGQTPGRNNAYVFIVDDITVDSRNVSFRIVGRAQ